MPKEAIDKEVEHTQYMYSKTTAKVQPWLDCQF